MAASSVFQRSSWKLDQLTPTVCAAASEYAFRTAADMDARVYGGPKWTVSPVYEGMLKEALDAAVAATRAGVEGRALFDVTCDIFEAAGEPTQRTKKAGETLSDGFFHSLGHGVGLEVHEAPGMGRNSKKPLVAGDVVTVEPGLYRAGYGGVRLEDIVLVTEGGAEVLTDYPYDLEP